MDQLARDRALRVAEVLTRRTETDVARYLARLLWHATSHEVADYPSGPSTCAMCREAREVGSTLREPLDTIGWGDG